MKLISDWNLFSCCLPRTEDIQSPGCTPLKTECNIVSFRSSSSLSPLSVHSRPEAATNKEQKMSRNIMTSSQSLVCYYEMENANIRIRNIFIVLYNKFSKIVFNHNLLFFEVNGKWKFILYFF